MTVSRTVCLGFLAVILAGAVGLTLPISIAAGTGYDLPRLFHIALFSSTSAVCVTGLSVVDCGEALYGVWSGDFGAVGPNWWTWIYDGDDGVAVGLEAAVEPAR